MRIGLRTIKTAVGAMAAMLIAYYLHLEYWSAAGIITILSVQNTTKSSLRLVSFRVISTFLAFLIAIICFKVIGFNAIAFGAYLLFFIPVANVFKLQDGIVLSSVLVTHFLIEKSTSLYWLTNEFELMVIGAGIAILLNFFMPNLEDRIVAYQLQVENIMKEILKSMQYQLTSNSPSHSVWHNLGELKTAISTGMNWTIQHDENQLMSENDYYSAYFEMRHNQYEILRQMQASLDAIPLPVNQGYKIAECLGATADTLAENNSAQELLGQVQTLQRNFAASDLPQSRIEFENRAQLYLFLKDFEQILILKRNFYAILTTKRR